MPRVGQELASFSLCLLGPLFSGSVPQEGEPVCQPFRGLERLAGHRNAPRAETAVGFGRCGWQRWWWSGLLPAAQAADPFS